MLELEAGPLVPIRRDELVPFPARPSFETLLLQAIGGLAGADARLASSAIQTTESPPTDLEGLFQSTVGAAAAHVNDELARAPGSPTPTLVNQGDATDQIRQSVLQYLPQPDMPINADYAPPPGPFDPHRRPPGTPPTGTAQPKPE